MRLEEMEVMVVHKLDGKGTAFAVTNDNENVFINGKLAADLEIGDRCDAVCIPNACDHSDRTPWQTIKITRKQDEPQQLSEAAEPLSLRQQVFQALQEEPDVMFKVSDIMDALDMDHGRNEVLREAEGLFAVGSICKAQVHSAGHFKKPTFNLYAHSIDAFE
jgi:hypothetical protein